MIFLVAILFGLLIFLWCVCNKLKNENNDYHHLYCSIDAAEEVLNSVKKEVAEAENKCAELQKQRDEVTSELQDIKTEIRVKKDNLEANMTMLREAAEKELQASNEAEKAKLRLDYEKQKQVFINQVAAAEQDSQKQIERINLSLQQVKESSEQEQIRYNSLSQEARDKYLSVIQSFKELEDQNESHKIQIKEADKQDIQYLLDTVAPHIIHKDTLYKLIWSEYIQTPTNEMLDRILPSRECAGIYKITNLNNKRAYIGRSTNVKKRLQDHIKSAIGISSIADQWVHHVMLEDGIWNFSYELLEECSKDKLGEREKYYIDFFDTQRYGYNQIGGSAFKG